MSDAVVADFVRDIVAGRLPAGHALPSEPELVLRFGISKVVVRDAISRLAALGLVRVQQGKRSVVLDDSEWNVLAPALQRAFLETGQVRELLEQLYEARLIVEPVAAALCAERSTGAQVRDLAALIGEMEQIANQTQDVEAFLRVDQQFHGLIATTVGNVALRAMIRDLHRQTAMAWTTSNTRQEDLLELAQQHARVWEAIDHRSAEAARTAMQTHLESARRLEIERVAE